MSSSAHKAYHESLGLIERHQVTCSVHDQLRFITDLRDELTRKLSALKRTPYAETEHGLEFTADD